MGPKSQHGQLATEQLNIVSLTRTLGRSMGVYFAYLACVLIDYYVNNNPCSHHSITHPLKKSSLCSQRLLLCQVPSDLTQTEVLTWWGWGNQLRQGHLSRLGSGSTGIQTNGPCFFWALSTLCDVLCAGTDCSLVQRTKDGIKDEWQKGLRMELGKIKFLSPGQKCLWWFFLFHIFLHNLIF